MAQLVVREDSDGIATLTLNRPEALNALSPNLFVELRAHVDAIARVEAIGCVVLRGAGRSFSAGNDLKAIQAGEEAPHPRFQAETIERLSALPQAVIAAVHGHCYTGALELALGADIILAAESAKFCDTHGKWGMAPRWGMSQRLPRKIGEARALAMMLTGRVVSGQEAAAIGLAMACVPDARFEAETRALASQVAGQSRASIRAYKMLVHGGSGLPLKAAIDFEWANSPGRTAETAERLKRFGNA
jgi:enoyl-CoA hydratase